MLSDSLGLEPSSELQDLQRRVLQHDRRSAVGESSTSNTQCGSAIAQQPTDPATPLIDSDDGWAARRSS